MSASALQTRHPATEDSGNFYLVDRLATAINHQQRAALLLVASDDMMLSRVVPLTRVCEEIGFVDGAKFIAVRVAVLCAKRKPNGELPEPLRGQFDFWRRGLAAIAKVQS